MTGEYTYKETYYLIQDVNVLEVIVPDIILIKIGFPNENGAIRYNLIPQWLKDKLNIVDSVKLGMILNNQMLLPDSKVGHCIQLTPYAKLLESTTSVRDWISKSDFELAKLQYNVSKFYTQEEYKEKIQELTNELQ